MSLAVVVALDLVDLGFQGYWLLGARTQSTALDTLSRAKLNFISTNTNTDWEKRTQFTASNALFRFKLNFKSTNSSKKLQSTKTS